MLDIYIEVVILVCVFVVIAILIKVYFNLIRSSRITISVLNVANIVSFLCICVAYKWQAL